MKRYLAGLLLLITFSPALAMAMDVAAPADAGISEERLERIDAAIDQAIKEGEIPGAVALVARHGKIV
ncbi:MAG TPA: hypothetical protein VJN01_13750, partial [Xanthomonadales bacterium]|nr:hypothetical protein [Xanthomonadales bacterium]